MKLILTRPLITFDLESTGVDTSTARVVQIAAIKRFPDGRVEEKNILINPTIAIPLEASEIHGITDEMVKDAPTFAQVSKGVKVWFSGSDIAGFNSDNYDVPLLSEEFDRVGITFIDWDLNFVDVLKLYRNSFPNKLTDIYKRFTGEELDGAHDALNDVRATDVVLEHLLNLGTEIPSTPREIDEMLQGDRKRYDLAGKIYINEEGVHCWSFGKCIDQPVTADLGFANWVLKNGFPSDTKTKIRKLLK
jgi:DNA polymerase-3 subunit epsilon